MWNLPTPPEPVAPDHTPPLAVVLTCTGCRHSFEPDPRTFATGRVSCPQCRGWTWTAALAAPLAEGGDRDE